MASVTFGCVRWILLEEESPLEKFLLVCWIIINGLIGLGSTLKRLNPPLLVVSVVGWKVLLQAVQRDMKGTFIAPSSCFCILMEGKEVCISLTRRKSRYQQQTTPAAQVCVVKTKRHREDELQATSLLCYLTYVLSENTKYYPDTEWMLILVSHLFIVAFCLFY